MTNSFQTLIPKVYFSKVFFCKVYQADAFSKLCEFISSAQSVYQPAISFKRPKIPGVSKKPGQRAQNFPIKTRCPLAYSENPPIPSTLWSLFGEFWAFSPLGLVGEICLLKRHITSNKNFNFNFFTLYPYVLHYGPMEGSNNGEPVITFKNALPNPDEAWHDPQPHDPLSLVDQVGK